MFLFGLSASERVLGRLDWGFGVRTFFLAGGSDGLSEGGNAASVEPDPREGTFLAATDAIFKYAVVYYLF